MRNIEYAVLTEIKSAPSSKKRKRFRFDNVIEFVLARCATAYQEHLSGNGEIWNKF